MSRNLCCSFILVLVIGLISPFEATAQPRVALVIGNSAYQNVPALPNPVNDATDISAALKQLGFEVKTLTDAKFDDIRRALILFGQQARGAEFAVIFFAGHGMEIGGENWLVPVDAHLASDLDVESETIGLRSLIRVVSTTQKLGLVILDACRNNPFLPKMQRTTMTRAVDRGFVRVEPNDNVLVAYSARDGTTANDGSGRNSPFTSSLLKNIATPSLDVRFLFASVRDDVMAATQRQQQPFVYGSLSKSLIYLNSSLPAATAFPDSVYVSPTPPLGLHSSATTGPNVATADSQASVMPPTSNMPPPASPLVERTQLDFIFQDSDSRRLSDGDLRTLSKDDLRIARNEIFARRGRYFNAPDLTARFSKFAWYVPRTWDPVLNAVERENVALIDRFEAGGSAMAGGIIFPDSDRRLLTPSDLRRLSKDDLRIARNEIFARRGRYFESADLKARFERFSWYAPNTWNPKLNKIEQANVALIEQAGKR